MSSEAQSPRKTVKDCTECRVIGTCSFGAISLYALYLRSTTNIQDKKKRVFLTAFSALFAGLAIARGAFS